jgi:hypothetical protein
MKKTRSTLRVRSLRSVSIWLAAFAAVGWAAACGGTSSSGISGFTEDGGGNAPGSGTSGNTNSDGGPLNSFGTNDGATAVVDSSADDCPLSATLVYVTGEGSKLYSFYPPTTTFTLIGTLNCLDSPTHMTVDRQGTAWVVSDGQIYKASTADASCSAVSTWNPDITFDDFALTFVGVSNTVDNTLYLMNESSQLGSFNIATGVLNTIGSVKISSTLGDMTSNGDGTLYFLQDVENPTLYNVDPTNGSIIGSNGLANATGGGSQALAFWGGSFYAFESDTIYQFDPVKKTTGMIGTAPLQVTGAGQSTCVPKVPPATN